MMKNDYHTSNKRQETLSCRLLILAVCCFFTMYMPLHAQKIGGNVYGGGNEGDVGKNTTVELKSGIIEGNVFGGARNANVDGRTYVNIAATNTLVANSVYGGNDVSGTVGQSDDELPFIPKATEVTKAWNSLIYVEKNTTYPIMIGSLYGGGNGAYSDDYYTGDKKKPELEKTYIELHGGIYGSIYGGGNNATVTDNTVIYAALNGTVDRISNTYAAYAPLLGFSEGDDYVFDGEDMVFKYHVNRVFGGNNLAEMAIRPIWHLMSGNINNLYSGGNRGAMKNPKGLLLALQSDLLSVKNVYGGCRMADVNPGSNSPSGETFDGYDFPAGYASRVYVTDGNIENVYGGNDISGKVYYGTNVVIRSNISGDVYGGGNGSYAYTDKIAASDYYYNPNSAESSLKALYLHRPHIEKSFIHIAAGVDVDKPTVVGKNVYCGGNSATLAALDGDQAAASATLKIDKNVTINSVFLGSNGANMLEPTILEQYAHPDYSSIGGIVVGENISAKIGEYMKAVSVCNLPKVEWDENLDYTTRIGSFFCGGNKGSMTYDGLATMGTVPNTLTFPDGIVIYEKIVAGCNDASVIVDDLIVYDGGLTGEPNNGAKVRLNVMSRLEPKETDAVSYQDADGNLNENKMVYLKGNIYGGCYTSGMVNGSVEINIANDLISPSLDKDIIKASGDYINASTLAVYGGGYGKNSVIKGNTMINLADKARVLLVFGGGEMGGVTGNTVVKLDKALTSEDNKLNVYKVYAGGYAGPVDGNTTLELYGGSVMSAFAGACNADIGGSSEIIVGHNDNIGKGLPYVTHAVYGGNDFGGIISGNKSYQVDINDTIVRNVRTQTYVKYICGKIGRAVYGGSYGSYEYNNTELYSEDNHTRPTLIAAVNKKVGDADDIILTNTFVDIASLSVSDNDIIGSGSVPLTLIGGGGRGYKGLPEYVKVGQTYVLLHSKARDNGFIAQRVYGGGNLSVVNKTIVDAYTGSYGTLFGGTHGVKTEVEADLGASYDCGDTEINIYSGIENNSLDIYGAGANSGVTGTACVNLHGGRVRNVYGGALAEGYTANTEVNVMSNSTIRAAAIFGGGQGEDEGRPCDVGQSSVTFASNKATVEDGIYGGNHNARATKKTLVTISVPVKDQYGNFLSIYGAGYGAGTVAGSTHVVLNAGAEVANVYGGGREGRVYNEYDYSTVAGYTNDDRQAKWQISDYSQNTLVEINGTSEKIARVTGNVYGAGLGEVANTCGKTKVCLLGGTVDGDIYGGGYAGTMLSLDDAKEYDANIGTLCTIEGGQVRNVFGGGYQGKIEGNSGVSIGTIDGAEFFDGVPTILRSAYGGGEMAVVTGTSTVDMYNGYIGYRYHADAEENNKYQPELKLNADDEANLLSENGNLYGAGFGEGAVVMQTKVRLFGGTIRNGLYGGGEIAAVGDGTYNTTTKEYTVNNGGQTNIYMYGGLVVGDVFGGGRGYSYDLTGNQVIGKTLYSDGYVFGKTNVEIYRGTIGTVASVADGHGNVFGGGNIGYVYSAGVKYEGTTDATKINGHYYHTKDDPYTTDITENDTCRTEDCRVHVAAGCYVKNGSVTILGKTFNTGDFIHNDTLNTLTYNDAAWTKLDTVGVTIRNAVFAGGNVSAGSDKVYANAVTVFGNATAAVVDVFSRDMVTLGGEHVGGLYGDGNLTFVDGYRELNITNYGTDYYHLNPENTKKTITQEDYDELSAREKAYYTAEKGEDDAIQYTILRTSGRMMNTIQRADFCGVFGSRFLLHGAQDRVPDVADYTNYTINRVGEVSLNTETQGDVTHGNYFGIYNVVNLLGALTSNVDFKSARQASMYRDTIGASATEPSTSETYKPANSYYDFKLGNFGKGFRNKANSLNMVALASGVFLELVKDYETNGDKIYGPVTGVIELDLINVRTGEGGGYVYAKNEHGSPQEVNDNIKKHLTLSKANEGAITQRAFTYDPDNKEDMQTSGNFVHDEHRIVDDCFPNGGNVNSPAHFWYVIGNYYVYDQTLSAYTGGANSYEQSVNIPFTITNGSNGKVQIISIKPNKYFVGADGVTSYKFGGKEYHLNDIISYWDWTQLPIGDEGPRRYFVDMTYIAQEEAGDYEQGDVISEATYDGLSDEIKQAFRISNEMSRDNGYLLTYGMTNPLEWDTYFTNATNKADKLLGSELAGKTESEREKYLQAPTIQCTESGIYGQRVYNSEDLVSQSVVDEHKLIAESTEDNIKDAYEALSDSKPQAQFDVAYVATSEILIGNTSYNEGSYISQTAYNNLTDVQKTAFEKAYLCIRTIEVAEKDYVLNGELISKTRYDQLSDLIDDANDSYMYGVEISEHFSPAYVCVRQDPEDNDTYYYGGTYFEAGTNYSALDICALSHSDRQAKKTNGEPVFVFNKDALDLFYTNFSDNIQDYGSPYYEENQYLYVDFEATYTGNKTSLKKTDGTSRTIENGDVLNREDYQQLLNEQAHYVKVTLSEGDNYIVKTQFKHDNANYLVGAVLDSVTYNSLGENKSYCSYYNNSSSYTDAYFCREDYKPLGSINNISIGTVISTTEFESLPNDQTDFSIVGRASTETSTLYVPRESDIENLSKDRIITVQMEYIYNENGKEKLENHVVNIHVQFKSGQPSIGNVAPPATVLPNTTVGLSVPTVTPGAYEIIGGGWEIFKNENDARAHKNGAQYRNNATAMYWYQNGYYVAYYAKTYLGKVYSNPVPFSIANYHRMSEVMTHPEYMYIDHEHASRARAPKIYLDDANDLKRLNDLFKETVKDESKLNARVKGCANLDFILNKDVQVDGSWTSIGNGTQCFEGTLHANGHTISMLDHSLFGNMCGEVYNLGVTGSFTGGGVAENGGTAENCWVYTTGELSADINAVIGNGGDVINCYYRADNAYNPAGKAIKKSTAEFAKGEVAYLLNKYHIDRLNSAGQSNNYVERYFADGDFIYAKGEIPLSTDERYDETLGKYIPNNDDYIFFGQRLTYNNATHGNLPTRIIKTVNDRGSELIDRTEKGNRVYSAPAYYMNSNRQKVYFNTAASFVDTYGSMDIHKGLTAIDFTDYKKNSSDISYLDYDGLQNITIAGLTPNLLVYADPVNDNISYNKLNIYLSEPALSLNNDNLNVGQQTQTIRGHLVDLSGGNYIANCDHFLVDKENFNVPIAYKFANGKHMWYQRTPDYFANRDGKGWDIVCLPFTTEYVTTHQKGEITHFYAGSKTNHEYWLRELSGVETVVENDVTTTEAAFASLAAVVGNRHTVYNYFLNDYYYSVYNQQSNQQSNQQDVNNDSYQTYYNEPRTYDGYPFMKANTPYIMAFPGESYYEFDMSGKFVPENTGTRIDKLDKQVVTMISEMESEIGVTDEETLSVVKGNYQFIGTFQKKEVDAGYMIKENNVSDNGTFFQKIDADGTVTVPFRGYLVASSKSNSPERIFIRGAKEIDEPIEDTTIRGLNIYGKKGIICIESTLEEDVVVTIHSTTGELVKKVTVRAMSKETVPVPAHGIYIVNRQKIAAL